MLRVLRVENQDGTGPYNACRWDMELPFTEWHVTPAQDKGIERVPEREEFCGFTGVGQLKAWFSGYFGGLIKGGFSLRAYECPDELVTVGEKQVIFQKDQAVSVREFSLSIFGE